MKFSLLCVLWLFCASIASGQTVTPPLKQTLYETFELRSNFCTNAYIDEFCECVDSKGKANIDAHLKFARDDAGASPKIKQTVSWALVEAFKTCAVEGGLTNLEDLKGTARNMALREKFGKNK